MGHPASGELFARNKHEVQRVDRKTCRKEQRDQGGFWEVSRKGLRRKENGGLRVGKSHIAVYLLLVPLLPPK